jgi:hypothetical protein
MKLIALIDDQSVIEKILRHMVRQVCCTGASKSKVLLANGVQRNVKTFGGMMARPC